MGWTTSIDKIETCARCERPESAGRYVTSAGPAELWRGQPLCDDCADHVSAASVEYVRWVRAQKRNSAK